MQTPLRKLFDFGTEAATHMFNRFGHLEPAWIAVNKRGSHVPLVIPDMSDKDRVAQIVRDFLKEQGATRYVSMLECWLYIGKELPQEIKEGKSLEHHPDRREAINIHAEDNEGHSISGHMFILRPEHGKPKLSPIKIHSEDTEHEGRFVGMFG